MRVTKEDVQRKISLTSKQSKAFASLVRAVGRCRKENIFFYQNLETLSALNGLNVASVTDSIGMHRSVRDFNEDNDPRCLQRLYYPSVKTECSWTDDNHYVILK